MNKGQEVLATGLMQPGAMRLLATQGFPHVWTGRPVAYRWDWSQPRFLKNHLHVASRRHQRFGWSRPRDSGGLRRRPNANKLFFFRAHPGDTKLILFLGGTLIGWKKLLALRASFLRTPNRAMISLVPDWKRH